MSGKESSIFRALQEGRIAEAKAKEEKKKKVKEGGEEITCPECGYVGPSEEFEGEDCIVCPDCGYEIEGEDESQEEPKGNDPETDPENKEDEIPEGEKEPEGDQLEEGEELITESFTIATCATCGEVTMIKEGEELGKCEECETELQEKVKIVVRNGKVVKKIVKIHKKKILTAAQKAALKKARAHAHTASANTQRKKSMKKAAKVEGMTDETREHVEEMLNILKVPEDIQEAFKAEDMEKVSTFLKEKYGIDLEA